MTVFSVNFRGSHQYLLLLSQFPHLAFVRGPRSPALEERMRAAMGATEERSAGRPPYPEWHVYWFLSIQVLPDISSLAITCTYLFTADDNHLQKSTILTSVICRYTGHQQSLHQPKFDHFFLKIWSWNHMGVCVIRLPYFISAHNTFYIIWSTTYIVKILFHTQYQSWHLTNDHFCMVEIIGIQNYAFHDPMPGHQLNILWQNGVSDLYIFDHQWVNISFSSILERLMPQSKVDHSEIWSFVKCGFLPFSCT